MNNLLFCINPEIIVKAHIDEPGMFVNDECKWLRWGGIYNATGLVANENMNLCYIVNDTPVLAERFFEIEEIVAPHK